MDASLADVAAFFSSQLLYVYAVLFLLISISRFGFSSNVTAEEKKKEILDYSRSERKEIWILLSSRT